jgi:hypothetical protein
MFEPRPSRSRWLSTRLETIGLHLKGRNVSGGRPRARLSCLARNGRSATRGRKRDGRCRCRASRVARAAFFSQTCPIEIAVGRPQARSQGTRARHHWRRPWKRLADRTDSDAAICGIYMIKSGWLRLVIALSPSRPWIWSAIQCPARAAPLSQNAGRRFGAGA